MIQKKEIKFRFLTDYRICNYRCPYCIIGNNKTKSIPRYNKEENYLNVINALLKLPFLVDVRIGVQGEFFLNKTLINGAKTLSLSSNCKAVNLITNLSLPLHYYLNKLQQFDLTKLALVASFHENQIRDKNKWLETAKELNKIIDFSVVLVAWPPILEKLKTIKSVFEKEGLNVFIQAFQGLFDNKKYPESYTENERKILRDIFYSSHDYEYMVDLKKPGLCYAGVDYLFIDESGDIFRCNKIREKLGNVFSGELNLYYAPRPCTLNSCFCDTDNMNLQEFRQNYIHTGLNQHIYKQITKSDPSRNNLKFSELY